MTYSEAKAKREELYRLHREWSDHLTAISGERLANGLTPDDVKFSDRWQRARRNQCNAFEAIRRHNTMMAKRFSREMREERRNKRAA